MIIDVYSADDRLTEEEGPAMMSTDHPLLLSPGEMSCAPYLPLVAIGKLRELFFRGTELSNPVNGPKNNVKHIVALTQDRAILQEIVSKYLPVAIKLVDHNREDVIDKFGVASTENGDMVRTQDYVEGIARLLKHSIQGGKDLVVFTHNANPQYPVLGIGSRLPRVKKEAPLWLGGIHSAQIKTIDPESRTFTGEVKWSDYIERCHPTSRWVAHPIPEEVRFKHSGQVFVRDIDSFFGYNFTASTEANVKLREYIMPLVEQAEKMMASASK